jgi:hypothetical protein
MVAIPKLICDKAIAYGLRCMPDEQGEHRILPADDSAPWYLIYKKSHWVLIVNDIPQINFSYDETLKFLDRFAPNDPDLAD